jgi:hypothetical protein
MRLKSILLLILHTLLIVLRMLQPGGVRKLAAENILFKQQLMVVRRKQKRVPKLSVLDRLSFGFLASMIQPARLFKVCIVIKPATILKFQMKDSLWSVDLFRCESMLLKSYWVMVVMDQFTRRI